jgi:hypothetical protein
MQTCLLCKNSIHHMVIYGNYRRVIRLASFTVSPVIDLWPAPGNGAAFYQRGILHGSNR